jgi:hypothetical protein
MTHEAGKGDKQRPTDQNKYGSNYDLIWGNKQKQDDAMRRQLEDAKTLASDPAGFKKREKKND